MKNANKKLIYILAGLNVLNFTDRYILSAVAPSIQRDLGFSDAQLGMLGTAFLWGFVLASPFVSGLLRRFSPQIVLAFAVLTWSTATAATGVVRLLFAMIALRAIIGVGQAIFSSISPALIDSLADKAWKAQAMSIFYAAVPIGVAIGFIFGGFLDMVVGWQMAFVSAGILGIPIALFMHRLQQIKLPQNKNINQVKNQLIILARHPRYVLTVAGNIFLEFTIAGFAFWAPIYLSRQLNYPSAEGSILFGIIFITTGLIGTFLGGWLVSKYLAKQDRISLLKLLFVLLVPASMAGFVGIAAGTALGFFISMAMVQLLLFACYTPFALVFFQSIPHGLKEKASSTNMFLSRLLGDMLGIWLVGTLSGALGSLALAIYILPFMLLVSAIFWWFSYKIPDFSAGIV